MPSAAFWQLIELQSISVHKLRRFLSVAISDGKLRPEKGHRLAAIRLGG
jgi:hypothetical protein